MTRRIAIVLAALLLVAAGAGIILAPVAVSAAAAQPLQITLERTGARTLSSPSYVAGRPVAITVDATQRTIRAASVAITDATGTIVRGDFARTDPRRLLATVALPHGGSWNLTLVTTNGGESQAESPLLLNVADADVTRTATLLLVFAACAVLGGILVGVAAPRANA